MRLIIWFPEAKRLRLTAAARSYLKPIISGTDPAEDRLIGYTLWQLEE